MRKLTVSEPENVRVKPAEPTREQSLGGQVFYFCERDTGAVRFCVTSDESGQISEDHAAGLLAMQCITHGLSPADYMLLVPAQGQSFERVSNRAAELLEAGRAIATPVQLSGREREVLAGIMNSLLNKEIAADLNISERTVKFHVSSLLAKFRVRSRFELMQVAQNSATTHSNIPAEPKRMMLPSLRLLPA
jgi:DNA-binding CsgD family transcriptional regulator